MMLAVDYCIYDVLTKQFFFFMLLAHERIEIFSLLFLNYITSLFSLE